jgi:Domain of unknown function (DUF6542)
VRLTGRGAILGLFAVTFLGLLFADWLNWGALADVFFVAGCGVAAWYTRPGGLLPLITSPPIVFLGACTGVKLLTSTGGMSATEGVLVTLANSAPWLFAGTLLTVVIALPRGLMRDCRALLDGLHGNPRPPRVTR